MNIDVRTSNSSRDLREAIFTRVSSIAEQSSDGDELLRRLADEFLTEFHAALVAVERSDWPQPVMVVGQRRTAMDVPRDEIKRLLKRAGVGPAASTVREETSGSTWRALHVEVTPQPDRLAMLLVYQPENQPNASQQVGDLKRLNFYSQGIRERISKSKVSTKPTTIPIRTTEFSAAATEQRNLQSHDLSILHRSLSLDETAYRIVNETRRWTQVDRVSLVLPKRKRARVIAVSGVEKVDRRAATVRYLERLTDAVSVFEKPILLPSAEPQADAVVEPLNEYLDTSQSTQILYLPLTSEDLSRQSLEDMPDEEEKRLAGLNGSALILESFRGPLESVSPQHLRPLRREAAFSLANAKQHQSIPMIGLLTAISPLTDLIRSRWFALLAASMIGLFIAAAIITTDHYVIATGEVQPVERQEVFVAVEGAVQDILVEDGQPVQAGDVLMRLDSSELRSQSEQLAGQIASMSQRLAALSSMQVTDVDSDENASSSRLAMEFRQYSEEIGHLREQKTLIDEQIDQLTIRSPRDGVVMAWRLRERFLGRPLQRGNHVMTIGQLNDDWRLELRLPDRYAAEALQLINKETLDVSFVVATDPTKSFDAIVRTISRAVRKDQQGQYVHDVVALVGSEQKLEGLRGGANATAKIYVDERSILSSWTSDLVAFVHRRILFYL